MKKILYFFPDNIGSQTAGNKARALNLLKYFAQKNYEVDFVSLLHEREDVGKEAETISFLTDNKLAGNVYLLPRKPGKKNVVSYFLKYKLWDLFYYLFNFPLRSSIPTFLTVKLKRSFEELLKRQLYDYIIISYIYYADLIANKSLLGYAKTIIDTHDFITAQFKDKKGFNLNVTLKDEIDRLNKFDQVWAISAEERYIFDQFCKPEVKLVTMMMDAPQPAVKPYTHRDYDLIYVASDNVHNKKAADWFFTKVYPSLDTGLKICVVGKINNHIPDSYNVERVLYAPDLDSYYQNARVAICPMFSGTGIKVKVVEALAYGLPVICTPYGTDGLPNKIDNGCLVSDDPAGFAQLITAILNDKELYNTQSALALQFFNDCFETGKVFKELDHIFETKQS